MDTDGDAEANTSCKMNRFVFGISGFPLGDRGVLFAHFREKTIKSK